MNIKQVVVTGPNTVELQDAVIDERSLKPSEVLVETDSTFISAGTELANYTGLDPRVFVPGSWCCYPWKAGYSNVGTVKAVGKQVTKVKLGQRIFTFGPHASAHIHDTNKLITVETDELKMNAHEIAACRTASFPMMAVQVAQIQINRWVAVFGLGVVGNLAAQMFRIMGCRVIGIDPSVNRRKLAKACGINNTIGGKAEEVNRLIGEITEGHKVDTAVDAVGNSLVVEECVKACVDFGEVILLGTPRGDVQGNLTWLLNELHARWITVKSALEWRIPIYPQPGCSQSILGNYHDIFSLIMGKELKITPLISYILKPHQIKEAYEGLLRKKDEYVGVAISWSGKQN